MPPHILPQHYLQQFASPSNSKDVWRYDIHSREFKLLPIKNVAMSNDFYSAEDERWLSEEIEGPAQYGLQRLRDRQPLDFESRCKIAAYLDSMIKRVPRTRRKLLGTDPRLKPRALEMIRTELEGWASSCDMTPEELSLHLDDWESGKGDTPLTLKNDIVRHQWASSRIIHAVFLMAWTMIASHGPDRFVTGDNAVFIHDGYGLGNPESEFSVPLSTDVALHGSWPHSNRSNLTYVTASPALVKEINRRTVFLAERFVYCHREEPWIPRLAAESPRRFNRIPW